MVALEALTVPAAPGSPDLRSLSIKPPPLSHSAWEWFVETESRAKNLPHRCWHDFLLVFFCHLHGFLENTVLRS